jgi:hypothetical protein
MMRPFVLAFAIAAAVMMLFLLCIPVSAAEYSAYDAAKAAAQNDGKPLLVLCCTSPCAPCESLRPYYGALEENGHCVFLHTAVHMPLLCRLGAARFPILYIYRHIGKQWYQWRLCGADEICAYAEGKTKLAQPK